MRRHQFCPRSAESWCKYQADKITKKKTYKQHISIPAAVSNLIKPIFSHKDLASAKLLERCVDGETQNVNEALNQIIWKKIPKDVFVGKNTLDMGVHSAIISYNDGFSGLLKVLKACGLKTGILTERFVQTHDTIRVKASDRRSSEPVKMRRKKLHCIRKGYQDKNEEVEGEMYL